MQLHKSGVAFIQNILFRTHQFKINSSPLGQADFTISAVLRAICGGRPQLHAPRLAATANSTCEKGGFKHQIDNHQSAIINLLK